MRWLRPSSSILRSLRAPPSSARRHASSWSTADAFRTEEKFKTEEDGDWPSVLKVDTQHQRTTATATRKSRVQLLVEKTSQIERLRLREEEPKSEVEEDIKVDDEGITCPTDTLPLYEHILKGEEDQAWVLFWQIIDKGLHGEPSASIWHWYFMIGLVARDRTVNIRDVLRMASNAPTSELNFRRSDIHQSLKDPNESGGIAGQQRILAFTLMHNLRKRTTTEGYKAALYVWDSLLRANISPSTRHISAMCVTLIHMGRYEEAIERLFASITSGAAPRDVHGWMASNEQGGAHMDQYTVAMVMNAFLLEGYPKRAYEMFKVAISDKCAVPIDHVPLSLLMWAGKQSYEGLTMGDGDLLTDLRENAQHEGIKAKDVEHWKGQAIWDGYPSVVQARHIFLTYLFKRHPELKAVKNPLYEARTGEDSGMLWKTHARMQRWSQKLTDIISPLVRWHNSPGDAALLTLPASAIPAEEEPTTLDEKNFDYYLELLVYVDAFEEVAWEEYVLVFAWMKHLDVVPSPYSVLRVCWALDHLIPPVAEHTSCAGPLHDYLAEWIGEKNIPTRERFEAYVRSQRFEQT